MAPGSTPPDGVTTAGSVVRVEHVGEGTSGQSDDDCTTEGPADANGVTYCPGQVVVDLADSLVVTQLSAPEGLEVADPASQSVDPVACGNDFCSGPDVIFDDRAVDAPSAVDDSVEATSGQPVELALLDNDDLRARDVTGLTTTAPAHGTVTVVDAASGTVRYTPTTGYEASDTFTYTVITAAGSASATVTVEVGAVSSSPTTSSAGGVVPAATGRVTVDQGVTAPSWPPRAPRRGSGPSASWVRC